MICGRVCVCAGVFFFFFFVELLLAVRWPVFIQSFAVPTVLGSNELGRLDIELTNESVIAYAA
jgi:hypothetical protein